MMRVKYVVCSALTLTVILSLPVGVMAQTGYNTPVLMPSEGHTVITWDVLSTPDVAFQLYFSGSGRWLAEAGSTMTFNITEVDEDVQGVVTLGNATWTAHDDDIARDLTLSVGVYGEHAWTPGLVIPTQGGALAALNESAHRAAARVSGNYMNGTMTTRTEALTVAAGTFQCIVFEYQQDNMGFGEPQQTYLAYDTVTGILVRANTSYSFGIPYHLELELKAVSLPYQQDIWGVAPYVAGVVGAVVFVVVVAAVVRKRK